MERKIGHLMAVFVVGATLTAAGTTYTWTNAQGDGDWTKPGNFTVGTVQEPTGEEDAATVCPGADDDVFIPVNTTVALEYDTSDSVKKASCEAFAAVRQIRPYAYSVIDITVPGGETLALSCGIARGSNESNYDMGHLIKRGAGEIDLNAFGHIVTSGEYYDYYCEMTVKEGVVKLPQSDLGEYFHLGRVTIEENGTLFTVHTSGGATSTMGTEFYMLYGSGTITNDATSACRMKVTKSAEFSGRITGRHNTYYSGGCVHLTGENSTFGSSSSPVYVYANYNSEVDTPGSATFALKKIGMKAVDGVPMPSSMGYADELIMRAHGGALIYLGDGETTDKDFRIWNAEEKEPSYIDGGAFGGLIWTGVWGPRDTMVSTYQHNMLRLILQGSNTQECVMSGKIISPTQFTTNYTFCITKQGTGTWRMVHNDASDMRGVWRIVNGTLRFDTLADAGVNSALGKSTRLYKNTQGLALDANKVDYAFWLGGGTGGSRANLEYVGETNCVSTTRRFAVTGTGAILNNGDGFLRLSDFFATNAPTTLVLGGSNPLENVADGIADGGNATMSVVKEGNGTWRLGTNCTFTGSLDVKGGTLIVGNAELYNYYRWIVKESFFGSATRDGSTSQMFGLRSFGLFDADGNDRTYGVTDGADGDGEWTMGSYYTGTKYNYEGVFGSNGREIGFLGVKEGHVRITKYNGDSLRVSRSPATVMQDLFLHTNLTGYVWSRDYQYPPWHEDPNSWIMFTIHPVKGAPITSWDFVNNLAAESGSSRKAFQLIKMCELQASVDGCEWDSLANLDYDGYGTEYRPPVNTWRSDNTTVYQVGYTTHTTGMPIPPGPTNAVAFTASSVSVAAGAELIARAPEKPVIRALTVDGLAGGGTIDGFAFASDLTLTIDNVASAAGLTIPMTLRNVEGLEASDWTVSVGDKVKAGLHVIASSSGLTITPTGMQFIVR